MSVIVKYGDDCRQELLAVQLLWSMKKIFEGAELPLWLHPHAILVVGKQAALIETIPNVKSLHQHKKLQVWFVVSLSFVSLSPRETPLICAICFGPGLERRAVWPISWLSATLQRVWLPIASPAMCSRSKTGNAFFSALLLLFLTYGRHNGNILLDTDGRIIHIDFGFMLGSSPGGMGFESAPFKLTSEWVELMGGVHSDLFHYFEVASCFVFCVSSHFCQALLVKGFAELLKWREKVLVLVEMMTVGRGRGKGRQPISCLQDGAQVVTALRNRLDALGKTDEEIGRAVKQLVSVSINSTTTVLYDKFQYLQNKIEYKSEL